jgi:hypothetical protein
MQRLYFNLNTGAKSLVPVSECPSISEETNFPFTDVPDTVTLEMVGFEYVQGKKVLKINFPQAPVIETTTL